MSSTIILKNNAEASKVPSPGDLVLGELAINTTDGKIYLKKGDGSVVEVSGGSLPNPLANFTLKNYGESLNEIGTAQSTQNIDISLGNVVTMTVLGATTLTFTTTHPNSSLTLLISNAGNNVTWPAIKWEGGIEPIWSTTGDDLITLVKIGTVWIGGALIGVA